MRTPESRTNYRPYFPDGKFSLDRAEVLKSAQTEYCGEMFEDTYEYREQVYFEDIQAYIDSGNHSVVAIDVADALKPGKVCRRSTLERIDQAAFPAQTLPEILGRTGVKTMADLYRFMMEPGAAAGWDWAADGYRFHKEFVPAVRTFSPFVAIHPIKAPKKWTRTHLWRAIISGQIYRGTPNWEYSEVLKFCYEYCYPINFLALELIKDAGGHARSIEPVCSDDGTAVITLKNGERAHTLYFDPACDREEAERRSDQRLMELGMGKEDFEFWSRLNPWRWWWHR